MHIRSTAALSAIGSLFLAFHGAGNAGNARDADGIRTGRAGPASGGGLHRASIGSPAHRASVADDRQRIERAGAPPAAAPPMVVLKGTVLAQDASYGVALLSRDGAPAAVVFQGGPAAAAGAGPRATR